MPVLVPGRRCASSSSSATPHKNEQHHREGGGRDPGAWDGVPLRGGITLKRAIIRRRIGSNGQVATQCRIDTVVSACTAEAYDFNRLFAFLESTFPQVSNIQGEVIHVKTPHPVEQTVEAFFFADGCFVLWGAPSEVAQLMLRFRDSIKPFEVNPLTRCETETLFFRHTRSDAFFAGMEGETIVLEVPAREDADQVVKAKLAFSNGLADSAKLAVLENSLEEHIERVRPIPLALANGGRLLVGRADVLRLTGELLQFRAQLNLHSELTDTPEMYWSEPELEEIYHKVGRVLDIRQRAHVLNKRLDYANELADVLRSHLSEQHGLKLEWGIIALIAVEVAFETLHWIVD